MSYTFNIFAVQADSVPGQGTPLFTIDSSTVPSPATFYAGVTSWIVGDTDDTMVYPANTVLTSGQVLNSGSGTYYNIYPNGGVYYYNDASDITNSTGSVLYIDQVEASPGIYQIRGDPDNQSNWNVVSQLNGNSAIVGTQVNYLDTSPLSGSNNSPPATYFLAIAQVAPPSVKFTLYVKANNAVSGGSSGSGPRLAQFTGTTYDIPPPAGVYGGVTNWIIRSTDDNSGFYDPGQSVSSQQPLSQDANGTYYNLTPGPSVFYYQTNSALNTNIESPLYIDQSTVSGNNDVFQVVATSANHTYWEVASVINNGNLNILGQVINVGDVASLTGASSNVSYELVQPDTPPPANIRFTLYTTEEAATNGTVSGTEPRLAQFDVTTYTVPTATGVYAGVTKWRVILSDDANSLSVPYLTSGTTFSGTGTYYNLAPYSGTVYYYDTADDITSSSETPIYIDQSTVSGNNDVYQVLATSANQPSWVVNSQTSGNSSVVDQVINVGNVTSLTGAGQNAIYYLVKVQAPPPPSITFTFYASVANAQNGGADGNGPRLAQSTGTTYTVPTATGVYGGVTAWVIRQTDDSTGIYTVGTIINSLETLATAANGTYYNLTPGPSVFYYQTNSALNTNIESPLYIDQSTVSGNNDVFQVVATSANHTYWEVASVINNGNLNILGQVINVGDVASLTGASSNVSYELVQPDTPPPANIRFTLYAVPENAQNGGSSGSAPRLAQFTGTTYSVPTATGVYGGVTKWIIAATDDDGSNGYGVGEPLVAGTTFDGGNGTYYNLAPFGAVLYYNTQTEVINSPETPIYIDQSTISGNNDVYQVLATSANQTSWVVYNSAGSGLSGQTVSVGDNILIGADVNSFYALVKVQAPPPTSVKLTLYAKATDAQNGGPNGNGPRLAQFTSTTFTGQIFTLIAPTGVYGGVTVWTIQSSDSTILNAGELIAAESISDNNNATYFNLSPYGGVFYYNTASDITSNPNTPIYIDQSTIEPAGDVYKVVATSANQTSWVINSQLNGNSTIVGETVAVDAYRLGGAINNPSAFYYLVKVQANPPTSVKFTLYANGTNAVNGGPNGNGPRLAQFTGTTYSVPSGTGVYGGVTTWTVAASDDPNFSNGARITAGNTLANGTGTYYNLAPYSAVYYYNTASDVTNSPETPIYIDQSTISGNNGVYQVLATSANQTSWVVNAGSSALVGQTVAVGANVLTHSNNVFAYFLVKVQAPRPPCFLEGSTILTDNGYVTIESIRPGMLVQTNLDGLKKVEVVGYSSIYNPSSTDRLKNRLYVCKKDNYPELTEDLVLTGDHSILVDDITDEERELMIESLGRIFVTSNKYRLTAQADARALPYPIEGTFNVWHLALENDLDNTNYGIYANGGLLVESAPIKALKTKENVTLV